MLLSLLTPSNKFALNKHFFIIIDAIIDTGKSPGMENSGGKKSGGVKSGRENSGGEKSRRGIFRRGKFRLRGRWSDPRVVWVDHGILNLRQCMQHFEFWLRVRCLVARYFDVVQIKIIVSMIR